MPDKKGIEKIQHGRIDFYIPIRFETSDSYEDLCHKVNIFLDNDINSHISEIQQSLQDAMDAAQDRLYKEENGKLSIERTINKWFREKREAEGSPVPRTNDGTSMTISVSERGQRIEMLPGELTAYYERCEELNHEFEQYKRVYGIGFVNAQLRFALWPIHIQLVSGEYVWLNAVLYVFRNKMGILKIEIPLVNVLIQPLLDYDFDAYFQGSADQWGIIPQNAELSIDSISKAYLQKIEKIKGLKIMMMEGTLRNILLSHYQGMPKQINNIPVEIQEDLYRIIAAPVSIIGSSSYRQTAREYIDKHSWGDHGMKYILSTTGGCLSIVDDDIVNWLRDHYREVWQVGKLDVEDIETIDKAIIRDLCINVEFVLVILLLKRMNAAYIYGMKRVKPEEIFDAQMKYDNMLMFISEIQEYCYGTASEQVEAFERLMPYYLKDKLTSEKMQAIDRVLASEEKYRYERFQSFLALAGLVMALVFGLPAIYDTIGIIRAFFSFITYDVPILSIENISIGIWGGLIVLLVVQFLRTKKMNRKRVSQC